MYFGGDAGEGMRENIFGALLTFLNLIKFFLLFSRLCLAIELIKGERFRKRKQKIPTSSVMGRRTKKKSELVE